MSQRGGARLQVADGPRGVRARESVARRPTRLGRREARLRCGAGCGWDSTGQSRGGRRRRKHHNEGVSDRVRSAASVRPPRDWVFGTVRRASDRPVASGRRLAPQTAELIGTVTGFVGSRFSRFAPPPPVSLRLLPFRFLPFHSRRSALPRPLHPLRDPRVVASTQPFCIEPSLYVGNDRGGSSRPRPSPRATSPATATRHPTAATGFRRGATTGPPWPITPPPRRVRAVSSGRAAAPSLASRSLVNIFQNRNR